MPPRRLDLLLETAGSLLRRDPRPDTELLARFLDDGDESAFEALLERHTAAVRAACRGWLRSPADIDDAAQATFLVLVRRARSIRNRAVLGRWLYRVATNVARRLQQQQRRCSPVPEEVPGREPAPDDGLRDLLAEEVARLPEKYRKLGPLAKVESDVAKPLLVFQALGTALEGTYIAFDPKEKPAPGKRPLFQKPNRFDPKSRDR